MDAAKILVVDDAPILRLLYRRALESAGWRVVEAENGRDALEAVGTTPVDLILMDVDMPRMDGLEALRRLRGMGDETPVVIITGRDAVDAGAAARLGADGFLSKPVDVQVMRQTVGDAMARRKSRRPATGDPESVEDRPAVFGEIERAIADRKYDEAAELVDQTLAALPDSGDAHALSGALLDARGREHAAYHEYRRALALDPGLDLARDGIRRYCRRAGLDEHDPHINPAASFSGRPA